MSAFDRAWRIAKEEAPIEPFTWSYTNDDFEEGKRGFRSDKTIHQVRDLPLKDGTVVPTAYQVFHEVDGSATFFSPSEFGNVSHPTHLWDGDLTHLVAHHICDGCGDELGKIHQSEEEFDEGFTDNLCWDCQGKRDEEGME